MKTDYVMHLQRHDVQYEKDKAAVIRLLDAVVQEKAVVVHVLNELLTQTAVFAPLWFYYLKIIHN